MKNPEKMKLLQVDLAKIFKLTGFEKKNLAVSLDDFFSKQRKNLVYQQFEVVNLN